MVIEQQANQSQITCEKHDISYSPTIKIGSNFYQNSCPSCAKERATKERGQSADAQKALELENARRQRIRRANIPTRYIGADIKNPLIKCEDSRRAYRTAYSYAKNLENNCGKIGRSMIMTGRVGTGKTHTGCAIINHALSKDITAVYARYTTIMRNVKQSYTDKADSESSILDLYTKPSLLVVDEISAGCTAWEERIFGDLIASRYDELLPTVLISNLSLREIEQELGSRVMSRISDNGGVILEFNWESYRE